MNISNKKKSYFKSEVKRDHAHYLIENKISQLPSDYPPL